MINYIYKNKSGGGHIKIVGITALDHRAQYIDDDTVEFSITKDDLNKYWEIQKNEEIINS